MSIGTSVPSIRVTTKTASRCSCRCRRTGTAGSCGQGGGGTEGSIPSATGTNSGSAGSNFGIINGYAVASQDGGHENTDLTACKTTNPNTVGNASEFYLDPLANIMNAYQSIEVTQLTAKYLANRYYGKGPSHSYWVGCSTGGRQAMVMSQNFPSFFDGIVAGDPVYDLEAIDLTETNGVEAILSVYNSNSRAAAARGK